MEKKIGLIGKSRESELINWRNFEEKKKNFTQITWTKKILAKLGMWTFLFQASQYKI